MYRSHFINGSSETITYFKRYSNVLNRVTGLSKAMLYHKKIQWRKNNSKKIWKTINFILHTHNKIDNCKFISLNIWVYDILTEDPKKVANNFNTFFTENGQKLAETKQPNDHRDYKTFLNKKISNPIYLTPPSTTEIFSIISSLNAAKASGYDDIPS